MTDKRKKNTKKPLRKNRAATPKYKANYGRTASGKVPQGRTLKTHDHYLSGGKKTGSTK